MSIVSDVFGSGFELYDFLSKKSKVKNVSRRMVIRELRNNIKRLEQRNNRDIDRRRLIENLENEQILLAISSGFKFNSLAPKREVDNAILKVFPVAKRNMGWDADRIISSIDEKIVSLKETIDLYADINTAPVNITSRLNNLYLLLVLLTLLIKESNSKK